MTEVSCLQGLFSRAVQQSGAWTHPGWKVLTEEEAARVASYAALLLGCGEGPDQDQLDCLQALEFSDLLNLQNSSFVSPPAAVIDGLLLTRHPAESLARGEINVKEVIIGANRDEGLLDTVNLLLDPGMYEELSSHWDHWGPLIFFGAREEGAETTITQQDVEQAYQVLQYNIGDIENFNPQHFDSLTMMLTDLYWYCSHTYAEMMSDQGVTVYQYMFSYKGYSSLQNQQTNNNTNNQGAAFRRTWLS